MSNTGARHLYMWLLLALPAGMGMAADPPGDARDLVRVTRLDEYLANVANDAAATAHQRGRFSEAELACMQNFAPSDFSPGLAPALAQYLSAPEIQQALKFYRSPTGVWLVTSTFAVIEGKRQGTGGDDKLSVSPQQEADLSAFAETSAGRKLLDVRVMMKFAAVENLMKSQVGAAMSRCLKPA